MDKIQRKALTARYKETPQDAGIYKISNLPEAKIFIGYSVNVKARINRHQAMLRFGSETVAGLQADWQRLGADAFSFEVVDVLEPLDVPGYSPLEDLKALEAIWCDKLKPYARPGITNQPKVKPVRIFACLLHIGK